MNGGAAAREGLFERSVEIRALKTQEELDACVALQRETWGDDYHDVVPASILQIAQKVGGVVAGAFNETELVGFVFGLTGTRQGRLVHWSHMLAVKDRLRDRGIGRYLKEFQRDRLQEQGVGVMHWTFDPLVARNAHLNLQRLGVEVEEYVCEMYGDTGSALHRFGTDRFVVGWETSRSPGGRLAEERKWQHAPVLNGLKDGRRVPDGGLVRIEIPSDIEAVYAQSAAEAMRWRRTTRDAFEQCFKRGYGVAGFQREEVSGRCFYLLERRADGAGDKIQYVSHGSDGQA